MYILPSRSQTSSFRKKNSTDFDLILLFTLPNFRNHVSNIKTCLVVSNIQNNVLHAIGYKQNPDEKVYGSNGQKNTACVDSRAVYIKQKEKNRNHTNRERWSRRRWGEDLKGRWPQSRLPLRASASAQPSGSAWKELPQSSPLVEKYASFPSISHFLLFNPLFL